MLPNESHISHLAVSLSFNLGHSGGQRYYTMVGVFMSILFLSRSLINNNYCLPLPAVLCSPSIIAFQQCIRTVDGY